MFVVRFAEPFRPAKKSQPSRSRKRIFMCFVHCSHGWWNWQDRGKKKCLSMCCVCGNLCSSSLDLPCCSGNRGNCSQSGEAGWNHNSPIDTSLHSVAVQSQQPGRGNVSPTLSCLGDPLTPTSGAAFSRNPHQDTPSELWADPGELWLRCCLAKHHFSTPFIQSKYQVGWEKVFPSPVPSVLSSLMWENHTCCPGDWNTSRLARDCCVEPYVDPNHQEILWVLCPSFVVFRPSLVFVRLPGTDVWRSHPVCHPVPVSFLLKQEPLIFFHFELIPGV